MNELVVLAFHRGVEALVTNLIDCRADSALLVAAHVRCSLVSWATHLDRALILNVLLGALA